MHGEDVFRAAIRGKNVPILVLDQKWHRLFAVHGKTDEIQKAEAQLNSLIAKQGRLNTDLKEFRKLKNKLMDSIVQNMDAIAENEKDSVREKTIEEDKRLIDELNDKIAACEDELLDIPSAIREENEKLMLLSMDYFYAKLRVNQTESKEITDWITQVRIDLKKNIIRKQNRVINNREIYAYLHDIFGADVLDLFDIRYEDEGTVNVKDEEEES